MVVWPGIFVESPNEEDGFSSHLRPSCRCTWSPAFSLHGPLQMRHMRPYGAACVGSLQRSRASLRSVIHTFFQAAVPSSTSTRYLVQSITVISQEGKPQRLVSSFTVTAWVIGWSPNQFTIKPLTMWKVMENHKS